MATGRLLRAQQVPAQPVMMVRIAVQQHVRGWSTRHLAAGLPSLTSSQITRFHRKWVRVHVAPPPGALHLRPPPVTAGLLKHPEALRRDAW